MKPSALTTEMIAVQGALAQVAFRRSERALQSFAPDRRIAWRHRHHATPQGLAPSGTFAVTGA